MQASNNRGIAYVFILGVFPSMDAWMGPFTIMANKYFRQDLRFVMYVRKADLAVAGRDLAAFITGAGK